MKTRGTFMAVVALVAGLALAGTVAAENTNECPGREGRQERSMERESRRGRATEGEGRQEQVAEREGRRGRMDQARQRRQARECAGESCTGEGKQERVQQRRQQGRRNR